MTKMTDAFKKVFLGLGGNPKELAENNDVGDYIVDLESAIKEYVGDQTGDIIDDSEASSTKTYSSTKIESLIPENELPTPAVGDIGKVVSVVSDGESGAEYSLATPASGGGLKLIDVEIQNTGSSYIIGLPQGVTVDTIVNDINNGFDVKLKDTTYGDSSCSIYNLVNIGKVEIGDTGEIKNTVEFTCIFLSGSSHTVTLCKVKYTGFAWTYTETTVTGT